MNDPNGYTHTLAENSKNGREDTKTVNFLFWFFFRPLDKLQKNAQRNETWKEKRKKKLPSTF